MEGQPPQQTGVLGKRLVTYLSIYLSQNLNIISRSNSQSEKHSFQKGVENFCTYLIFYLMMYTNTVKIRILYFLCSFSQKCRKAKTVLHLFPQTIQAKQPSQLVSQAFGGRQSGKQFTNSDSLNSQGENISRTFPRIHGNLEILKK